MAPTLLNAVRPLCATRRGRHCKCIPSSHGNEETTMSWIDPAYCDLRLGFEVT
ncbi:MAG: pyrroloquinoline quinone precursor peptide PqqA, partial [Gammaproteobacteria bacterium]|nr:pyrroloquinoline quinone precursor peptide PqqA [Gammaproteobacteria bacterium]